MSKEEKKEYERIKNKYRIAWLDDFDVKFLLNLIENQQKEIGELKQYAMWHIEHLTEDILDYIDDDIKRNASIIGELKEEREHWRDIIKIINKQKTYIDYKNY